KSMQATAIEERHGVSIKDYNKQSQWFVTLSDKTGNAEKLIDNVDKFVRTYGLEDYYASNYRAVTQLNTPAVSKDGAINYMKDEKALDKALANGDMMYNPNGLLYDGYIFGVREATDLLIEYNELKNQKVAITAVDGKYVNIDGYFVKFKKGEHDGLTRYNIVKPDEALALAQAQALKTSEWIEYSTTEKFLANEAAASKYWITEERLGEVLDALLKGLGGNAELQDLLNQIGNPSSLVGGLLSGLDLGGLNLVALLGMVKGMIDPDGAKITVDTVVSLVVDNILLGMIAAPSKIAQGWTSIPTEDDLAEYNKAVATAQSLSETLGKIGVTIDTENLDAASIKAGIKTGLLALLKNISYYQHPENKYAWQFINKTADYSDLSIDLERYAWVKYHCEEFGRVAGCVLAATDAPLVGGKIGNGTPADQAYNLASLYQLRTDLSYQPKLYPVFAARRYLTMCLGLVALSIYLTSVCSKKENNYLQEIIEGGIQ
ncbi:MAG: hypothetical protein RSB20_02255, partial [Clostridia bacterium]